MYAGNAMLFVSAFALNDVSYVGPVSLSKLTVTVEGSAVELSATDVEERLLGDTYQRVVE